MDLVFTKEANARARACMLHERHLLQLVGMRRAPVRSNCCALWRKIHSLSLRNQRWIILFQSTQIHETIMDMRTEHMNERSHSNGNRFDINLTSSSFLKIYDLIVKT